MKRTGFLLPLLFAAPTVGGQAVMEGVMMRDRERLAIAVRKPGGDIHLDVRPWFTLTAAKILRKPFLRGFPILLETLVNGIKALNFSAQMAVEEDGDEGEIGPWAMGLTLAASIGFALLLFVVTPHLFSLGMKAAGLSGGVEALSFHVWDGLFKMLLFLGYILAISYLPDVRRVFEYHGAEHKVIWAYEQGAELSPAGARGFSRLHPRCGTAFLLFVLAISIVLYAFLIPWLLTFYAPATGWIKQAYIVALKLALMAPVSAVAYEVIKVAGKFHTSLVCRLISAPGLLMQLLTTKEPDDRQIEVALAALRGAVDRQPAS
ncbi:protein of unknown function DUF1385 [Solidesulfovibrio carbinoliphilus subsp. oakridgensis]|uniref:Metal-dependent enzyme n=1 Tax=Solidesulfovibrio carbinoliphilus subsp. oakridgensis TaxID=694327 RepID=G7QCZ2_9BACT|nr:DUF1385 domain-containing protein [Solidesulfovibrio carbinoliphilus]EHJ46298.1 protein of unknown function DUF1385 [Solidesulfovibrio carbinoliphilus subsp. oakridgensis]